MKIIGRLTWRLQLVKFVAFSLFLLLSLVLQPILFHIIVAEGHYMLCSIRRYLKKKRAELFDCGVTTVMSKITHIYVEWCAWCWHCVYVLLVRIKNLTLENQDWGSSIEDDFIVYSFTWSSIPDPRSPILDRRSSILLFQETIVRMQLCCKCWSAIPYSLCWASFWPCWYFCGCRDRYR